MFKYWLALTQELQLEGNKYNVVSYLIHQLFPFRFNTVWAFHWFWHLRRKNILFYSRVYHPSSSDKCQKIPLFLQCHEETFPSLKKTPTIKQKPTQHLVFFPLEIKLLFSSVYMELLEKRHPEYELVRDAILCKTALSRISTAMLPTFL